MAGEDLAEIDLAFTDTDAPAARNGFEWYLMAMADKVTNKLIAHLPEQN